MPKGQGCAPLTTILSKGFGINGIGLGADAIGTNKGFDLARICAMCGYACMIKALKQKLLVPAGGFADGKAVAFIGKRSQKAAQCRRAVTDFSTISGPTVMDDNAVFGDIHSDEAGIMV